MIVMTKKFKEAAALWKEEKRQRVKLSSYALYSTILNTHLLPAFGECRRITEEQLKSFAAELSGRQLRPSTIRIILLVLKMITRFAEKRFGWGHTDFDSCVPAAVESDAGACAAPEPQRPNLFTPAQERRLLEHLYGHFSLASLGILIGLLTGMRIGEICGLTWADVDLQRRMLHVQRTVQRLWLIDGDRRQCGIVTGPPKSATAAEEAVSGRCLRAFRTASADGAQDTAQPLLSDTQAAQTAASAFPRPAPHLRHALRREPLRLQNPLRHPRPLHDRHHHEPVRPPRRIC